MTDILIRGITKPTDCGKCFVGDRTMCVDGCPLIELPEHGDLISADDVQHVLDNLLKRTDDEAAIAFLEWAKDCVRVLPKIVLSNKEESK